MIGIDRAHTSTVHIKRILKPNQPTKPQSILMWMLIVTRLNIYIRMHYRERHVLRKGMRTNENQNAKAYTDKVKRITHIYVCILAWVHTVKSSSNSNHNHQIRCKARAHTHTTPHKYSRRSPVNKIMKRKRTLLWIKERKAKWTKFCCFCCVVCCCCCWCLVCIPFWIDRALHQVFFTQLWFSVRWDRDAINHLFLISVPRTNHLLILNFFRCSRSFYRKQYNDL